jgi:ribokinase
LITVGKSGENTIAVAPGANLRLTPQNVLAAEKAIRAADYVLLQLEVPMETVLTAARLAKFHQVPVVLNPAPAAELPPELISLVDMLTPNETELAILSGCESTVMFEDEARRYIADSGLNTLVVTMGSKGVFALHHGEEWNLPAYPVQVVDTTAAGDAFNAALVVALSDKVPMESALRFASAAAAISVTRQGAQTSLPNKEELQKFLSRRVVSR